MLAPPSEAQVELRKEAASLGMKKHPPLPSGNHREDVTKGEFSAKRRSLFQVGGKGAFNLLVFLHALFIIESRSITSPYKPVCHSQIKILLPL